MKFKDKENIEIKDDDLIVFQLPDLLIEKGFYEAFAEVKLCFFSKNEDQFIPFSKHYKEETLNDVLVVK